RDENELQHLVHTDLRHCSDGRGAFAVRYPRGAGTGDEMDEDLRCLPLGKGELLRERDDLAIVAIGSTVRQALGAADLLAEQGVHCTVVDARFLKPLDEDLILSVAQRCGQVMTVEENVLAGGFGSGVLELISSRRLGGIQVEVVAIPDEFVEHGQPQILRQKYGLDAKGLVQRALSAFPRLGMAAKVGA
ncbi:MAG TPA: transketolase C-terminal domain-containing protein, partial [Chloroflexota bacterium]|nr:transketolase C-terminal domain-containing protein [Chloroflexota bacterium]